MDVIISLGMTLSSSIADDPGSRSGPCLLHRSFSHLRAVFSTFEQSRHLHIGPTLVAQTDGRGMFWQKLQESPTQLQSSSKYPRKKIEKGDSVPPIEYRKNHETEQQLLSV